MLVRTTCGQCHAVLEVAELKIGKTIVCSKCDGQFVAQVVDFEEAVLNLAADEPDVQRPATSETARMGPAGKYNLTLPPPPAENWNELEEEEDREMQKRLDRLHFKSLGAILSLQEKLGAAAENQWANPPRS